MREYCNNMHLRDGVHFTLRLHYIENYDKCRLRNLKYDNLTSESKRAKLRNTRIVNFNLNWNGLKACVFL